MTRTTLLALAERVEAATGHDRALAKDIYRALFVLPEMGHPNGYGWRENDSGWWLATGEDARTPPKTIYPPQWLTSIDAAMSLVPSGHRFAMWPRDNDRTCVQMWHSDRRYCGFGLDVPEATASTPALALTSASLRAIAGSLADAG